jgi:hypothetical protein
VTLAGTHSSGLSRKEHPQRNGACHPISSRRQSRERWQASLDDFRNFLRSEECIEMAALVAALSCSSSTPPFVFPYLGRHDPKGKPI